MRGVLRALVVLQVLVPIGASAADEKVLIELNSVEGGDNRCRLNFVIQNKSDTAIESMKLDLVAFGTDGGILRRLITEMGPVRAAKTNVRASSSMRSAVSSAPFSSMTSRPARRASRAPASTASACHHGSTHCVFISSLRHK